MTQRPLKLGLALQGINAVPDMVEEARQAEAIGFDVVLLPDHLGFTAPLVPLVVIAEAPQRSKSAIWFSMARSTGQRCLPATWPAWIPPRVVD